MLRVSPTHQNAPKRTFAIACLWRSRPRRECFRECSSRLTGHRPGNTTGHLPLSVTLALFDLLLKPQFSILLSRAASQQPPAPATVSDMLSREPKRLFCWSCYIHDGSRRPDEEEKRIELQVGEIGGVVVRALSVTVGSVTGT